MSANESTSVAFAWSPIHEDTRANGERKKLRVGSSSFVTDVVAAAQKRDFRDCRSSSSSSSGRREGSGAAFI